MVYVVSVVVVAELYCGAKRKRPQRSGMAALGF
jgi:hypothetical protein